MRYRVVASAGFTLVELLVVIAIISVLAALLMPALEKSLEEARKVQCGSNERQVSQILQFYASDHEDFVPHGYSWYEVIANVGLAERPLPEETIGFWACPTQLPWMLEGYSWGSSAAWRSGFTMNGYSAPAVGGNYDGVTKVDTLTASPEQFLLAEAGRVTGGGRGFLRQDDDWYGQKIGVPHDGYSMLLFPDGHVQCTYLPHTTGWHTETPPWSAEE